MGNIEQIQVIANIRKFVEFLEDQDSEMLDRKMVIKKLNDLLIPTPTQVIELDGIQKCSDANMTFYVGEIHTTYQRLVEIFGQPTREGSGDNKVQVQWCFEFEDTGDVFTIYDWKEYGTEPEYVTEWHIGAHDHSVMERVEKYFDEKSMLLP